MKGLTTVRSYHDDPAIHINVAPGTLLSGVRVKGVGTGRIVACVGVVSPMVHEGKVYVGVPGLGIGETVAYDYLPVRQEDLEAWFMDDHEVALDDYLRESVACLQGPAPQDDTPETPTACDGTEEAPRDLPEADGPEEDDGGLRGGVTGCTVAELRTVLIETMRRQDRAMTVREIASILNSDTVDARTRIATVLADMEGKGLVKRGSYVPSQSPGRKSVSTWVVVA